MILVSMRRSKEQEYGCSTFVVVVVLAVNE